MVDTGFYQTEVWWTHTKEQLHYTWDQEWNTNWCGWGSRIVIIFLSHGLILAGWHREVHSSSLEHLEGTSGCNLGTCQGSSGSLGVDKLKDVHLFCRLPSWWCWDKILGFSFLLLQIPGCSSSMDMVQDLSHLP